MLGIGTRTGNSCLRCQLRQALQQASRSGSHFQGGILRQDLQKRFESTEADTASSDPPQQVKIRRVQHDDDQGSSTFKVISPNVKIRRRRGIQQREESGQLGIKSLGQDSEVIVLRDLPQTRRLSPGDEAVINVKGDAHRVGQSLTPDQIEALFKKQKLAGQDEINTAIDAQKPEEEIMSSKAFDQGVKKLLKGYSKGQLAKYLRSHRIEPQDTTHRTTRRMQSTVAGFGRIQRSEWRSVATETKGARKRTPRATYEPATKQELAEDIYRKAWNVQIEEDAEALGTIELVLTPEQWALLHTKDATNVWSVIGSGKFYQKSRIESQPEKRAIRVTGPAPEAEDIASLFETTFASATRVTIDVKPYLGGERKPSEVYTSTQLTVVMTATKTWINLDESQSKLHIHAFESIQTENAVRLLIALLQLPSSKTFRVFLDGEPKLAMVPVHASKTLPSSVRTDDLGRWVLPSSGPQADDQGLVGSKNPPVTLNKPFYQDILQHLTQLRVNATHADSSPPKNDSEQTIWSNEVTSPPSKATLGYLLHNRLSTTEIGKAQSKWGDIKVNQKSALFTSRQEDFRNKVSTFSSQALALTPILSRFDNTSSHPLLDQLSIRLVPLRTESDKVNTQALIELPKIEIALQFIPGTREQRYMVGHQYPIDNFKSVLVLGINATLQEYVYDIALPDKPVDLRFTRKRVVAADRTRALQNPDISNFIAEIVESIRSGGELRAPPRLEVPLAEWMVKGDTATSAKTKSISHSYFFAGFEYRRRKRYTPAAEVGPMEGYYFSNKHVLTVHDLEGGIGGGRRTEVSIHHTPIRAKKSTFTTDSSGELLSNDTKNDEEVGDLQSSDPDDSEALLKSALSTVDMVQDGQKGVLRPATDQSGSVGYSDSHVRSQYRIGQSSERKPLSFKWDRSTATKLSSKARKRMASA